MPTKPIRVLTIGRFYPPSHGGIERHIADLLAGLGRSVQADCIVVDNHHVLNLRQTAANFKLYPVRSLGVLASTPICPTMPYLARKLHQKNSYDILHLHFPNPMAHLVAYLLPRNIKLVITWHSDIIRQKRLLKFYQPFLKNIIHRADAVIAATPAHFSASDQLTKWGNPNQFHVVPYGIDTEIFTESSLDTTAVNSIKEKYSPKKIIFAVGRHVYYKGFEYLIRAMAAIPDAILLLGGHGPLTLQLKALTEALNLSARIFFLGRVPEAQLASYYHAADVFCLPSVEKSEAFGLVQLEAMACKKPVVCCELYNGVTYVTQNNNTGLVVPPRNPLALAQAINSLMYDEHRSSRLGINGYQRVMSEFTQKKMWHETLNIYQKMML